jgi:GNAT superfamily N-acetyltransferase
MDEQTTVEIAEASPSHLPLIAELTLRAYEPVLPNLYEGGYDSELADVSGRAESATVLVALFGGFVVGGVTYTDDSEPDVYEFNEPGASFRHLAVDPSAQGLGAGRALAGACIERARSAGHDQVLIHSVSAMSVAIDLYKRLGFARDESLDEQWGEVHGLGFRLRL